MTHYVFTGTRLSGETTSGEGDARNETALRYQLESQGIIVIDIIPKTIVYGQSRRAIHVRHGQVANFTRQLAAMTRAGLRLGTIFNVLLKQSHPGGWTQIVRDLSARVEEGMRLSEALSRHPKVFNQFYVSLVRAGEVSGDFSGVLSRLSRFLEDSDKLRRKVRAALAYPAVIMCVSLVVLLILLVYIVPVFKEMFLNFQTELPVLTKAVLLVSDLVNGNLLIIFLTLPVIGVAAWYLSQSQRTRLIVSKTALRIPGLRSLLIKSELSNFFQTMSTLLDGGVALGGALPQATTAVGNVRLRAEFESAMGVIRRGAPLHEAWVTSKLVPPMVVELTSVGEETGRLSEMFRTIAEFYAEEVESALPAMTSILEPMLIVIVGIFVAAILIAMYLPLFEIVGQLG
jgi:type IV pilus assembly protein PilC